MITSFFVVRLWSEWFNTIIGLQEKKGTSVKNKKFLIKKKAQEAYILTDTRLKYRLLGPFFY